MHLSLYAGTLLPSSGGLKLCQLLTSPWVGSATAEIWCACLLYMDIQPMLSSMLCSYSSDS